MTATLADLSLLKYCQACKVRGIEQYCCQVGLILVLPEEKEAIVQKTGRDDFGKLGNFYLAPKRDGGYCAFFEGGKCSIQEVKPVICKIFPLGVLLKEGKIQPALYTTCPAASQMPAQEKEEFLRRASEELRSIPASMLDELAQSVDWQWVEQAFEPRAVSRQ